MKRKEEEKEDYVTFDNFVTPHLNRINEFVRILSYAQNQVEMSSMKEELEAFQKHVASFCHESISRPRILLSTLFQGNCTSSLFRALTGFGNMDPNAFLIITKLMSNYHEILLSVFHYQSHLKKYLFKSILEKEIEMQYKFRYMNIKSYLQENSFLHISHSVNIFLHRAFFIVKQLSKNVWLLVNVLSNDMNFYILDTTNDQLHQFHSFVDEPSEFQVGEEHIKTSFKIPQIQYKFLISNFDLSSVTETRTEKQLCSTAELLLSSSSETTKKSTLREDFFYLQQQLKKNSEQIIRKTERILIYHYFAITIGFTYNPASLLNDGTKQKSFLVQL